MDCYSQIPSLKSPLETQIDSIKNDISKNLKTLPSLSTVLLIGSCSTGKATYRSDVDLLFVMKDPVTFSLTSELKEKAEAWFTKTSTSPLPLQMSFVSITAFQTTEPAMLRALQNSVILVDPEGDGDHSLKKIKGQNDDKSKSS